jgi:hypothetical protein
MVSLGCGIALREGDDTTNEDHPKRNALGVVRRGVVVSGTCDTLQESADLICLGLNAGAVPLRVRAQYSESVPAENIVGCPFMLSSSSDSGGSSALFSLYPLPRTRLARCASTTTTTCTQVTSLRGIVDAQQGRLKSKKHLKGP